jgi:hypothetical protein
MGFVEPVILIFPDGSERANMEQRSFSDRTKEGRPGPTRSRSWINESNCITVAGDQLFLVARVTIHKRGFASHAHSVYVLLCFAVLYQNSRNGKEAMLITPATYG